MDVMNAWIRAGALHPDLGSNPDPATFLGKLILPPPTSASSVRRWAKGVALLEGLRGKPLPSVAPNTTRLRWSPVTVLASVSFVGSSASSFNYWSLVSLFLSSPLGSFPICGFREPPK